MDYLLIFLFGIIFSTAIGCVIGDLREKQNGNIGAVLGALFGPFGWCIVAALPPNGKEHMDAHLNPEERKKVQRLQEQIDEIRERAFRRPPTYSDGGIPTYKL